MKLEDSRILYASTNHAWDEGWTFYQMLAEALARRNDVVYLDRPASIARPRGLRNLGATIVRPRLRVLRTPTLPLQRTEALRVAAARATAGFAARWARRARFAPDLVWVYTPYELRVAERFPAAKLVYWTGDEVVIPEEQRLLARSDAVLCVSTPVYDRHRARLGDRAHFVPVAIDFDRYRAAAGAPPDPGVAALPRPVFGWSGFVNDRIDVALLAALADAVPTGSVVLAGPMRLAAYAEDELRSRRNIHILGPQPAGRVPAIIAAFDVGLAPYRDTEFNRNANPVKFYEYLAVAKPVVATDIPTLRGFEHVASVGAADTFVARALEQAERATGTPDERVEVARAHSFDALLARLEALPL